jgi:hypothetical protein
MDLRACISVTGYLGNEDGVDTNKQMLDDLRVVKLCTTVSTFRIYESIDSSPSSTCKLCLDY